MGTKCMYVYWMGGTGTNASGILWPLCPFNVQIQYFMIAFHTSIYEHFNVGIIAVSLFFCSGHTIWTRYFANFDPHHVTFKCICRLYVYWKQPEPNQITPSQCYYLGHIANIWDIHGNPPEPRLDWPITKYNSNRHEKTIEPSTII